MHLKDYFLLLAILFAIGLAMHLYSKRKGKKLAFTASSWYQALGILLGLFLMWKWSTYVASGQVHALSEEIAKVIVRIVQGFVHFFGLTINKLQFTL